MANSSEIFRMLNYLNTLGFVQDKKYPYVFNRTIFFCVKSDVVDHKDPDLYDIHTYIEVHLNGYEINYQYSSPVALESGKLTITNVSYNDNDFSLAGLKSNLDRIFETLFDSSVYEFYTAPFYNPKTVAVIACRGLNSD